MTDTKKALIIGATGGIGNAIYTALDAWEIMPVSRASGFDLTDPDSVDRVLGGLHDTFDLVIVATGKLDGAGHAPEKSLRAVTAQAMADQFAVNAIGPALVLRHLPTLLPRDRPSKAAVLTARVGSIGDNRMGGWYSYRAAKAAANQIVHTAAIELARTHKQAALVALHPGTVATSFTKNYQASHKTVPPEEAAGNLLRVLDGIDPAQTGGFFDWAGETVPW